MRALTRNQQRVLDFVRAFRVENQMPPTRAEIAKHFGWSSANAAEECLQAIARRGHITLSRGGSRGIFDLECPAPGKSELLLAAEAAEDCLRNLGATLHADRLRDAIAAAQA